jgi:hypothetical protein
MYRNTAFPAPLTAWQRIGVSESRPWLSILYSSIYTLVMTVWVFPLLNLGVIALTLIALLLARRYVLSKLADRHPYLFLQFGFSLFFLAIHPANPMFVDPPLIALTFSPLWYEALAFAVASGAALVATKRFDLDVGETVPVIGISALWVVLFAVLLALPSSIVGVYG